MCGLVSVLSKQKYGFCETDLMMFEQLLYINQLRGEDGTGIFYNKDSKIIVEKAAIPSSEFIKKEAWQKALTSVYEYSSFLVGHSRFATVGKINNVHTHPFVSGNITLAHNGTLRNHKSLANCESDSEAICKSIDKVGLEATVDVVDGAYAIIWADTQTKTLNLLRNYQRPLYIVETETLYIIASELEMIKAATVRCKIDIKTSLSIPINTLYSFNYDTRELTTRTVKPTYVGSSYSSKATTPKQDSRSIIGKSALFSPVSIKKTRNGNNVLVGEVYSPQHSRLLPAHFHETKNTDIHHLSTCYELECFILQLVYDPLLKESYYVVRDVTESKPEKKTTRLMGYA